MFVTGQKPFGDIGAPIRTLPHGTANSTRPFTSVSCSGRKVLSSSAWTIPKLANTLAPKTGSAVPSTGNLDNEFSGQIGGTQCRRDENDHRQSCHKKMAKHAAPPGVSDCSYLTLQSGNGFVQNRARSGSFAAIFRRAGCGGTKYQTAMILRVVAEAVRNFVFAGLYRSRGRKDCAGNDQQTVLDLLRTL